MAQFDYFATWNDDWELLCNIFSIVSISLIPDKWYQDKNFIIYNKFNEELQAQLTQRRRAFLVPEHTIPNAAGLVLQNSGPKSGYYRIEQNRLGETLVLTLPACFDDNGITGLGSGNLFYAKEYFNHEMRTWQRPSKSLIDFYKQVRQVMRKHLVQSSAGTSKIWIGAEAKQLVESGKAKIKDRGL